MKAFCYFVAALLASNVCLAAAGQGVERTAHGVRLDVQGGKFRCEVMFYSPSIVRVVKAPQAAEPEEKSLAVVMTPEKTKFKVTETAGAVTLKSGTVSVTLGKDDGTVSFADAAGNNLLKEQGAPVFTPVTDGANKGYYGVSQSFTLDKDEPVYGIGQLQGGRLNLRGLDKYLVQTNIEDGSPFIQSAKGYGLYFDNYSPMTFKDDAAGMRFSFEVSACVDYYFMYGGNADGVVARVRQLTGQAPMFPLWTYGYWQSRERYKGQDELVGVVRKYRELGVPLDGIIQDWQYWGDNYHWNATEFLAPSFYDPQKMLDEIHSLNAHAAISVWPSFGPKTKPYADLAQKGLLYDFKTFPVPAYGDPKVPSGVKVYDAFSPEARDIVWRHMNEGIFKYGMDAWWLDATEAELIDPTPAQLDQPTALGSFRKMRNAYPLVSVGGVYDHQRATTDSKRVFIFTRSCYFGQQRYAANVWSGDITASWETLRKQVPAGLNYSLCGMPHWNNDIGGFYAGHYIQGYGLAAQNPQYQELYVRWLQFGAFTPMMRSHGTGSPREIYLFGKKGEPAYDAIEKTIRLRYSLLPYIYSTSWDVTHGQSTFMRALVMDFPKDSRALDMGDEYMFGRSLLVAPVLEAQYTPEKLAEGGEKVSADFTQTRQTAVYLPQGTAWYDFFTGERFDGGQQIVRPVTLSDVPLYVRAGGIVPLGPDVQYATEKPWDALTLCVYPGADGRFVLYEDEFDNYNYERGAYTEIPMTWDEASRSLTIGARSGSYPGMLASRKFIVRMPDGRQQTVDYSGKAVTVRF